MGDLCRNAMSRQHQSDVKRRKRGSVGWQNKTWAWDIGTTPMGFDVVDVVGGVSYSNDLGPIGYTINAHRRPISSSLLAFAGQKDTNTGTTWGGVRATGGGVSISYDKGEANGIWSSLNAESLTGKNVEDNWRVRWMTGYYYKLINKNNERLTVGVSNMLWHYDKDLSGYTLGQGGYYSPQEYVSFALPVTWRKRTENWSGSWAGLSHGLTLKPTMCCAIPFRDSFPSMSQAATPTGGDGNRQQLLRHRLYRAGHCRAPGHVQLVCGSWRGYSGSERLYPKPCAALCTLLRRRLAG